VRQERELLFCRIRLDLKRIGASIPLLLVPQTWVLSRLFLEDSPQERREVGYGAS
jgi:hypothetical protein